MSDKCERCSREKVCKYKEIYERETKLVDTSKLSESFIVIDHHCKYF